MLRIATTLIGADDADARLVVAEPSRPLLSRRVLGDVGLRRLRSRIGDRPAVFVMVGEMRERMPDFVDGNFQRGRIAARVYAEYTAAAPVFGGIDGDKPHVGTDAGALQR